jgi:SAM-dependent methyltransferase
MSELRQAKDRFLSIPWVYDRLRPAVIGYIDHARLAAFCGLGPQDRVFDLGCGTARLVRHLGCERYLGVDVDEAALDRARRYAAPEIRFLAGDVWDDAVRELDPTVVLMIGLVHHVSDADFGRIVGRLRRVGPSVRRLVTFETTFLPGRPLNNLLSRLDRGRFVRRPAEYETLFGASGLRVLHSEVLPTRLRFARYIGYHLEFAPKGDTTAGSTR